MIVAVVTDAVINLIHGSRYSLITVFPAKQTSSALASFFTARSPFLALRLRRFTHILSIFGVAELWALFS